MIEITYHKEYSKFSAEGHARSDEIGKDLICAGVTTLVYTLAAALEGLGNSGALLYPANIAMESGSAHISWIAKPSMRRTVELCVETVMGGFRILSEQYPEYVNFTVLG